MSAADKAATALASTHDVDLARLARGGDRLAFGQLVRRHGSAVRSLARRLGAEPAQADLIARDAFLGAYERIGEFRGETPFQAWVKQIGARACARELLREASPAGPSDSQAEALDRALAALPANERLSVGLCYGGGLSHGEAAAALKQTPEAVRASLRQAMNALRTRLDAPAATSEANERAFETRLDRLFAEPAAFGDAELFALRVADRLDRRWTARGAMIGALGMVGGMVVVAQAASTGVIARVQSLPHASGAAIGRALDHVLPWRLTISVSPFAMDVILIPVALAVLALGFAVVRAIREI